MGASGGSVKDTLFTFFHPSLMNEDEDEDEDAAWSLGGGGCVCSVVPKSCRIIRNFFIGI